MSQAASATGPGRGALVVCLTGVEALMDAKTVTGKAIGSCLLCLSWLNSATTVLWLFLYLTAGHKLNQLAVCWPIFSWKSI